MSASLTSLRRRRAAAAAIGAVCLWTFKPVLVSLLAGRLGFAEIFVVSSSIALVCSLFAGVARWRVVRTILTAGPGLQSPARDAVIAGCFLALWYYGFYRSLLAGASKVDATVIAFTWPLIAVIAVRLITPTTAAPLRPRQWLWLLLAFLGVTALSITHLSTLGQIGASDWEILWAWAAAVGSGAYLPFAMRASTAFGQRGAISQPAGTFVAISVTNAAALAAVLTVLAAFRQPLDFTRIDAGTLGICALIGIGIYLVAEVTWTWAMHSGDNLALASLPYFSPAVSVLLLAVLFDEPLGVLSVVGMVMVLCANLALHFSHRPKRAPRDVGSRKYDPWLR